MSKYNSKCPLNCSKKGCGTHLCQRYADYQQGRADKEEEIKEKAVFYSNQPIEDIYLKAYNKGARQFAEWCYINGKDFANMRLHNKSCYVDIALAEWQKGAY